MRALPYYKVFHVISSFRPSFLGFLLIVLYFSFLFFFFFVFFFLAVVEIKKGGGGESASLIPLEGLVSFFFTASSIR